MHAASGLCAASLIGVCRPEVCCPSTTFFGGRRTLLSRRRRLPQQATDPGSGATPPARCHWAVCWLSCRVLGVSAVHVHVQHPVLQRLLRRRIPAPPRFSRPRGRSFMSATLVAFWRLTAIWQVARSHSVCRLSGHVVFPTPTVEKYRSSEGSTPRTHILGRRCTLVLRRLYRCSTVSVPERRERHRREHRFGQSRCRSGLVMRAGR